ncbi:hypothetical protein ACPOL_6747 (plasmid) [Acidisarcina polymorpha]|uniref:Uncharacterized protein n=1 Tax=Acidisarcina polymorpha TaxID=2211140 RepID=A0A2Z5GAQ8_9BACT|nr:hypothetical protein [Acidisarcina polymorpha]AXC15957.1 hypothetical protein ACPOL_6747 [Acidisarcina polymorpha]
MGLLITILSLLAAVIAVTPRERQLDLRVRFKVLDWAIASIGTLALIGLEFYEFLETHFSFVPPEKSWPTGLTSKNAIYLIFLVVALVIPLRLRFAKLSKRRMSIFRELIEELYWNGNYGELIALLQTHLKSLFRIYRDDFPISRLRAKVYPLAFPHYDPAVIEEILKAVNGPSKTKPRKRRNEFQERLAFRFKRIAWRLLKLLPDGGTAKEDATELIRGIFFAPKFVTALSQTRPYLGLEIFTEFKNTFDRTEFIELFMRELLKDSHSVLFREIRNNQNMSGRRYQLPETNRLLFFLLKDLNFAKDVNIYKPVGDFMLTYLDELAAGTTKDPYNRPSDSEYERNGVWESPLYIGILFFDIMVREALFKGMEWHMWLYYMPLVVKEIEKNYSFDGLGSDHEHYQYPSRYAQLLYRIFRNMRDWILGVQDVPSDQANVKLRRADDEHENGNIPKSSIIAFCESLYTVLVSERIGEKTKASLADMAFEIYFELRASGKYDSYAVSILLAMTHEKSYAKQAPKYRGLLAKFFKEQRIEYRLKRKEEHVDSVQAALK